LVRSEPKQLHRYCPGDAWNAIQSIIAGDTSSPIKTTTTYTLTCLNLQGATLTKAATVNILPTFEEQ
jgi:hypothetical protein